MEKTPCEIILWDFLPALRRELVKAMIRNGISRKKIARKLHVTEAAISQYLKSKRGVNFKFNKHELEKIEKTAIMIANSEVIPAKEICKLCCLLKREESFKNYVRKKISFLPECVLKNELKVEK